LEAAARRERDPNRRFGPRTLDVDVISVWTAAGEPVTATDPELTLPHPRAPPARLRAPPVAGRPAVLPGCPVPAIVRDLVRAEPLAGDVAALVARPDLSLE
jgi:2-amino-4-hydroxy-6-hydroxymethyldihydropteridine diphosphokinase